MFVGYLRNDFEKELGELVNQNMLFESELLIQTHKVYPEYCYAAYDGNKIVAVLSAYCFKNHVFVNVLEALNGQEDLLQRLLNLLVKNSDNKNIFLLLENKLLDYVDRSLFKEHSNFVRYLHTGDAIAFNFSNTIAKQVSGEDYVNVSRRIDKDVFSDDRERFLTQDGVFSNSLKLSTTTGFLHSYVVNKKHIRISPWLMQKESFLDAEKLLRGVLHYRSLKKIFAYAPEGEKEIKELYESYNFKKDKNYKLLYCGSKPRLILECLYAI